MTTPLDPPSPGDMSPLVLGTHVKKFLSRRSGPPISRVNFKTIIAIRGGALVSPIFSLVEIGLIINSVYNIHFHKHNLNQCNIQKMKKCYILLLGNVERLSQTRRKLTSLSISFKNIISTYMENKKK